MRERLGRGEPHLPLRRLAVTEVTAYAFELVAAGASGDLAYTVGYERNNVRVEGRPSVYTLRVTHVYRREDRQWRIVHRHADLPPGADTDVLPR